MRFSWDRAEERLNVARHGVDFTTAQQAFADPKSIVLFDDAHSTRYELRWWLLGRVGSASCTFATPIVPAESSG